jgi:hypothetical protein
MLVEGLIVLVTPFFVLVGVLTVVVKLVKPLVALFDIFLVDVEVFLVAVEDFVIVGLIFPSTQRQSLIKFLVAYFRKGEEVRGLDRRDQQLVRAHIVERQYLLGIVEDTKVPGLSELETHLLSASIARG